MAPVFYDSMVIKNEFLNQGYNVTVIESKIFKEDFLHLKTIDSLLLFCINPFYKVRHTKKVIAKIKNMDFDLFLAVGIVSTTPHFFRYLRSINPNIKTVLYLWDSISVWDFSDILDYFDYKYSFDRLDCKKYESKKLIYLPYFYSNENKSGNLLYDISHVGTINKLYSKRLETLASVVCQAKVLGLRIFIRAHASSLNSIFFKKKKLMPSIRDLGRYLLDSKFRNHIKALKKHINKGFIFESNLEQEQFNQIIDKSKCILDVCVDNNTGISHRIIESLARGKKVITTNKHILNEDFYCPENISIIDKDNPKIDVEFINTPFKEIDISYLRIDNWIKKILKDSDALE